MALTLSNTAIPQADAQQKSWSKPFKRLIPIRFKNRKYLNPFSSQPVLYQDRSLAIVKTIGKLEAQAYPWVFLGSDNFYLVSQGGEPRCLQSKR